MSRALMLVSHRWLSELLPDAGREPDEFAEALSAVGLAVDAIFDFTDALRPVVIGTVEAIKPHPKRDQLQLVTVRLHPKGTSVMPPGSLPPPSRAFPRTPSVVTVVCGAKNVPAPGGQVVFAGLGCKLPGVDFVLERRDIGGVVSEGMLCSESELGLADSSAGILTFDGDRFQTGMRFIDAFPEARDTVFELDVTPNRPDALGHVGVARDLAAFFGVELKTPGPGHPAEGGKPTSKEVKVVNDDPERCARYGAALVRGVTLKSSPDFMRWRLHRLGIRPISNIVDITNWLMLEFGQPLHAFDLDKVRGSKIVVRRATASEKLTTLDEVEHELNEDDLLICDGEGPTALAGIMGGAVSEISDATSNVLIECAYFSPRGIRRTARRQGMHTESSHRFERGTDHGATELVLSRARSLICELGEGTAAPGSVRADGDIPDIPRIELRGSRMEKLLGVHVPFRDATRILQRLGLHVEFVRDTDEGSECAIRGASHRPDISIEHDLIEEVARIRGLDAIPTELPAIAPQEPRTSGKLEREVVRHAVELGLSEALTYSFVSSRDLELLSAPKPVISLSNPLTEERSVLRTSLAPGLLEALRRSRRRGEPRVQLFAVGARFLPVDTPDSESEARPRTNDDRGVLPYEEPTFAALLAGPRPEHLAPKPGDFDVYDAKAIAVEMVERVVRRPVEVMYVGAADRTRHLHPRGAGAVVVDGQEVALFGPLHPDVVEAFDLGGTAQLIEVNLATLEALGTTTPKYQPIPKVPPITRDLSLVISDMTSAASVAETIRSAAGDLCESVEVVTEFRGGSVPKGHRSLTVRVVYRDPAARQKGETARTLTDKEVDKVQSRVLEQTAKEVGATLR